MTISIQAQVGTMRQTGIAQEWKTKNLKRLSIKYLKRTESITVPRKELGLKRNPKQNLLKNKR